MGGLLKKGANKIALALGIKWLLAQVRAVAEGKYGPGAQNAYLWTIGKKRWWSVAMGTITAVLAAFGLNEWAAGAGVVAGVLMSAGVLDSSWRAPGAPDWLKQFAWYRWTEAHAEVVTGAFAFLLAPGGYFEVFCHGPRCDRFALVLLIIAAMGVHLGLLPAAWRARPPQLEVGGITVNPKDVAAVKDMRATLRAQRFTSGYVKPMYPRPDPPPDDDDSGRG